MKNHISIKFLLVVAVLIALTVGTVWATGYIPFAIAPGLTVTSVSTTSIISPDTDLAGVWFLINAITGGGQYLVGTLTPEETKIKSGYRSQYPLRIEMSPVDETVHYKIINERVPIWTYDIKVVEGDYSGYCSILLCTWKNAASCPAGTDYEVKIEGSHSAIHHTVFRRLCIRRLENAIKGRFDAPSIDYKADVTLTVAGTSITKPVSKGVPSASFYDPMGVLRATVQIPALLITGDSAPSETICTPVYNLDDRQWHVATADKYENYMMEKPTLEAALRMYAEAEVRCDSPSTADLRGSIDACAQRVRDVVNNFNGNVVNPLITATDSLAIGSTIDNRNDPNNGQVTLTLNRRLTVADVLFKVRADWIGVVIEVGKPKITAIDCTKDVGSGDPGKATITVTNIGTAPGTFIASLYGCEPIIQSYSPPPQTVGAGMSTTFKISTDTQTAGAVSKTCRVRVIDYNMATNYDEATVVCGFTEPALCRNGVYNVFGKCINLCAGGRWVEVECCDYGVNVLPNGTYVCGAEVCSGVGEVPPPDCCGDLLVSPTTGKCVRKPVCGNNVCEIEGGETSANCPDDCAPPITCGNDKCEPALGETYENCPDDCKPPIPEIPYLPGIVLGLGILIYGFAIFTERKTGKGLLGF